jgi:cAMP phosphodiesterase
LNLILLLRDSAIKAISFFLAIDAVQTSDVSNNFTKEEVRKVIEALITNQHLKDVLLEASVFGLTKRTKQSSEL